MKTKTIKKILLKLLFGAIASFFAVMIIVPVLYAIFGAFKDNQEVLTSAKLLPKKWTTENMVYAWKKINFFKYVANSVIIAFFAVITHVLFATMSAYAFSRRQRKCRIMRAIKKVYLVSMFFALGPCTLYPVFKMVNDLRMTESYLGLIFVEIGASVAHIILVEGYLSGIGESFDEAATIDGCSFFAIYWRIILPLIRPVMAVIALLSFTASWNSYMMPMILTMGRPELRPLTVAIVELRTDGEAATMWSVIMAGANISIIPMIIIYILANKQFVSGLTLGGIKG